MTQERTCPGHRCIGDRDVILTSPPSSGARRCPPCPPPGSIHRESPAREASGRTPATRSAGNHNKKVSKNKLINGALFEKNTARNIRWFGSVLLCGPVFIRSRLLSGPVKFGDACSIELFRAFSNGTRKTNKRRRVGSSGGRKEAVDQIARSPVKYLMDASEAS